MTNLELVRRLRSSVEPGFVPTKIPWPEVGPAPQQPLHLQMVERFRYSVALPEGGSSAVSWIGGYYRCGVPSYFTFHPIAAFSLPPRQVRTTEDQRSEARSSSQPHLALWHQECCHHKVPIEREDLVGEMGFECQHRAQVLRLLLPPLQGGPGPQALAAGAGLAKTVLFSSFLQQVLCFTFTFTTVLFI